MTTGGRLLSPAPGPRAWAPGWGRQGDESCGVRWPPGGSPCPFCASPESARKAGAEQRGKVAAQDRARAALLRKELGDLARQRADEELSIRKAR